MRNGISHGIAGIPTMKPGVSYHGVDEALGFGNVTPLITRSVSARADSPTYTAPARQDSNFVLTIDATPAAAATYVMAPAKNSWTSRIMFMSAIAGVTDSRLARMSHTPVWRQVHVR